MKRFFWLFCLPSFSNPEKRRSSVLRSGGVLASRPEECLKWDLLALSLPVPNCEFTASLEFNSVCNQGKIKHQTKLRRDIHSYRAQWSPGTVTPGCYVELNGEAAGGHLCGGYFGAHPVRSGGGPRTPPWKSSFSKTDDFVQNRQIGQFGDLCDLLIALA